MKTSLLIVTPLLLVVTSVVVQANDPACQKNTAANIHTDSNHMQMETIGCNCAGGTPKLHASGDHGRACLREEQDCDIAGQGTGYISCHWSSTP